MKQLVYFLIVVITAIICKGTATAQRILNLDTISISSEISPLDVSRTIESTNDGYIVTYTIHRLALDTDNDFQDCETPVMTGFCNNNVEGEPAYPYANDSFSIPCGQEASFQILEEEWVEFKSKPAPARSPEILFSERENTIRHTTPIKDFSGWFPLETINENNLRSYKNVAIYSLGIRPVKYDLSTGKAKICRKLQYKVSFNAATNLMNKSIQKNTDVTSEEENNFLSNVTLNWSAEQDKTENSTKIVGGPNSATQITSPGYLIITPTEFKSSADSFADWKRTLGNNVIVCHSNNWTNESVNDSIVKINNDTPLTYLLILGNHKKVPGYFYKMTLDIYENNKKNEQDVLTDLPYALATKEMVSEDDIIPELQYGRIPANNNTEVYNALKKIRYYESMTNASEQFFNSNLFISEFTHGYYIGTERLRNCQTSYELAQYVKDLDRVPNLAFYCRPDMDPLKWSQVTLYRSANGNTILNNDKNIPEHMLRPNYSWNASCDDIRDAINTGVSQVFYFAHGDWDQWKLPKFTIEDVRNLNNSDHNLPVIFSMACRTGSFLSDTCFAQEFLTKEYGGAAAVFGFTGNTYAGYTDVAAAGFFNGMWPTPGFYPRITWNDERFQLESNTNPSLTSLGMLANYARTRMSSAFPESAYQENKVKNYNLFEASILTLFGDPSMHIFLKKPTRIKCSISCVDKKNVKISAPDYAIITVFNGKTKEVRNYKGSTTDIELPSDRCPYSVCVHYPGTLPVVYNVGVSKGIAKKDIKLLREDWVWKYHQYFNIDYSDPNNTSGKDACSDIYLNIGFSGTTVIGGVEYQNCTIWKDGEEPANGEAPVIAYMREEGNRIYMREATPSGGLYQTLFNDYNISINPYICPALEWVPDSNTEMLIYDFDLDKGEILWFDSECRDDDAGLPVTLRYTGTVDNKEVDIQWFETRLDEEAAVYCGFGSADSLLPFPGTYNEFQWEPHRLIAITDRENNPVITMPTGGFPPLPDETGITSVKQTADVSYFDMQGRQVPKPDNGIFIRIERKSDGSVVTRKVCLRK